MEKVLGEEHPNTLKTMNNLAFLYSGRGKYEDAEKLCTKTLEIKKRVLGDEHPVTLISIHNLAYVLKNLSRPVEAIEMMQSVVMRRNKVLGADHLSTIGSYQALARWTTEHNAAVPSHTNSGGADTHTKTN
jgi:tetratricopeptide (TPR) repeat protein